MIDRMRNWLIPHVYLPLADVWLREGFVARWREAERTQWLPWDELAQIRAGALGRLLQHSADNVPYWQRTFADLGLGPDDFHDINVLQRLPIMTKQAYRDLGFEQVCAGNIAAHIANSTSGTSGTPFAFYMGKRLTSVKHANFYRAWGATGAGLGDRELKLWGPHKDSAAKVWFERLALGRAFFSAFAIDDQWAALEDLLTRFRPRHLEAYASAAYRLAQVARNQGLKHHFETVTVSAEPIQPAQRETIAEVFGTQVFNRYGSREFGTLAFECDRHTGMHICGEHFFIEVVDDQGEPVPPGHEGRLLITAFYNYAMPFIRYEIGDRGVVLPDQCPCGRGLTLLGPLSGRTTDFLEFPNGRVVPYLYFNYFFEQYGDRLQGFQVTQLEPALLQVALLPLGTLAADDIAVITRRLRDYIGAAVEVRVTPTQQLELTPAGKLRHVRSLVKDR
jgi:phenylacetate-CoA ligase